MTEIRHITPREQALERENDRLVDKTERQSATIHVQAVAIQAMKEEIAQLKALADNPEFDGIENANPAWWRGHEHTTIVFCKKVNEILDGKDDGKGVSNPPWEPTRRRLLAIQADAERYRFWRDRYPVTFAPTTMTPEDVDRCTDAAMKESK
jgi:hypothetical protein